jgi:hypothetical protein
VPSRAQEGHSQAIVSVVAWFATDQSLARLRSCARANAEPRRSLARRVQVLAVQRGKTRGAGGRSPDYRRGMGTKRVDGRDNGHSTKY